MVTPQPAPSASEIAAVFEAAFPSEFSEMYYMSPRTKGIVRGNWIFRSSKNHRFAFAGSIEECVEYSVSISEIKNPRVKRFFESI